MVPGLFRGPTDESQVGLVDQRRGLERLAWLLLRHPLGRQLAQLVVNQRQQFGGGPGVAVARGEKDSGHLIRRGHAKSVKKWRDAKLNSERFMPVRVVSPTP